MQAKALIANGFGSNQVAALAGDATAVTASTTQTQAGGTVITADYTNVTTTNANDAVTLSPSFRKGDEIFIRNVSANAGRLYPAAGGKLNNGAADAVLAITASRVLLVKMITDRDAFVVTSGAA